MEPDLHLFPRPPTRLPRAHAGDHGLGSASDPGGGEWIPGRGGFRTGEFIWKILSGEKLVNRMSGTNI